MPHACEKWWPEATKTQLKKLDKVYKSLELLPELPILARDILSQMYATAEHFEEQIDIAAIRIQNLFATYQIVLPETGEVRTATETVELLQTIPIFSTASARSLIAEAGLNIDYTYDTAKKLTRYLGLVPGSKKSGGKVISTESVVGNSHFKPMIVQGAASFLRRKDTKVGQNLLDWGREYQRSTDAQHARVALARIAVKAAWYVIKNKEVYDDDRYKLVSQTRLVTTNIQRLHTAATDLDRTIKPAHLNEKGLSDLTQTAMNLGQMVGLHIPRYTVLKFDNVPLETLGLKKATLTAFAKVGLTTSDALLHLISGSLPTLEGIGKTRFEAVITALQTHQYIKLAIGEKMTPSITKSSPLSLNLLPNFPPTPPLPNSR